MELRFLCFGAGAIGTYIGGSLTLAGFPVTFVERPGVAEELRARGLKLEIQGAAHSLDNPKVFSSLQEAMEHGPYDLGVFTVKAYDTEAALEVMQPFSERLPALISLQNGVENEEKIASVLGTERVLTATVTSAVGRLSAGSIVLEKLRGVGVASGNPLAVPLVEAMTKAGLRPRLYPDGESLKWSKMLTNLLANASSAILNMPPEKIFNRADLFAIEVHQLREALAVMRARNIAVTDLPGTPVRLLTWMFSSLPLWLARLLMARTLGKGRGGKMPSFFIDMQNGSKKSEVDYLNGAVVRFATRIGLDAPVNRVLNETLLAIVNGEINREVFDNQPERLVQKITSWRHKYCSSVDMG